MSKQIASNTFTEGLMKDTNPLTTPNNVLTDCLNGTTITYNGKEFVLQNDMGNAIVETASLKRGYIPIGLKEYNGIIYVVSYNPLENRVEFGSFPSPERNFSGDDFDPTGHDYEGCVLADSDFYTPNNKHPDVIYSVSVEGGQDIDSAVVVPEESTTIDNPITSTSFILYLSQYIDNNPLGIIGIEDYWKLDTKKGQPKFNISKSSITDDFSSYDALKLNTGDRFVIYYVDLTKINGVSSANYIEEIFLPYVSDSTTKRLFKVETFALTKSGRKKLDIDPFKYIETDTQTFLNGSLSENIKYNIYDFDNEGTIEIRISLEKPDYFSVKFRQYLLTAPAVKFTTLLNSNSFMQIKGYKYIFRYISTPSPMQKGYMYYTSDHLYTNTSDGFIRNVSQQGTVILTGLSFGTYSYEILPFTQYGFEYDLVKKGTFEVLENLTTLGDDIIMDEFWWNYIPGTDDTWQLHFNVDMPSVFNNPDQEITAQYLELYDVWSNCSHIIDLLVPPALPGDPYDTNVNFTNTFKLGGPDKTKDHVKSETGNIYGVPYSSLGQSTLAKLPSTDEMGSLNYENRTEYIDPAILTDVNLRKNHFYILAIYYTYYDNILQQSYTRGIYRYVYTNDEFQTLYTQNQIDFSNVGDYPPQNISLVVDNSLHTFVENHNLTIADSADNVTMLFDPMQQTYDASTDAPNNKNLTGYAIGPEDYFSDLVTADSFVSISGIMLNNFTSTKVYKYNLPLDAPGYIDTSIITISMALATPITLLGVRHASNSGTIGIPITDPIQVFGLLDDLIYTINVLKQDSQLSLTLTSQDFNVVTNKIYPYYSELVDLANVTYFYPLFYQLSREVQEKIVNNNSDSINITDPYLELHHHISLPQFSFVDFMRVYGTIINFNNYSSVVDPALQYGLLSMHGFWNNTPDKLGIHKSITTTGLSADKFLSATKGKDDTIPLLALLWRANRSDASLPNQTLRQYIPIWSHLQPTANKIREALEVPIDYNAANVFLFFGSQVNQGDYNYYKYYVDQQDYYYESSNSTLTYPLNNVGTLNFASTYCYKIVMGAKNKIISLQEEGSEENLRVYITARFPFQEYTNPDFFPRCLNVAPQAIDITETILVRPNSSNTMQALDDSRLAADPNNHPIYLNSGYTIDGTNNTNFIKNDFKESDKGTLLFNLMNLQGVSTSNASTVLMLREGPSALSGVTTYNNFYNGVQWQILDTYKLD